MGLFDSAKKIIDAAKDSASEALGEEGVEAIKALKDSVTEAGSQLSKAVKTAVDSSSGAISSSGDPGSFSANASGIQNGSTTIKVVETSASGGTRFVPALCTQCGAALSVDPSQEAAVCQYCGTPFIVSKAINKYNVEHADIHAEKVEIHKKGTVEATLDYVKERKAARDEERRRQEEAAKARAKKLIPVYFAVVLILFAFIGYKSYSEKKEIAAEEAALQQLVEEIQVCMDEGRYDEALVKASGLYFTSATGSTKKKWDRTRETLIKTIENAAKEAKEETALEPTASPSLWVTAAPEPTATSSPTAVESVPYSTNSLENAKKGNSGVFAYYRPDGDSFKYCIIDFDEGYVYSFTEGTGSTTCDKYAIDSGDLNDLLLISYFEGSDPCNICLFFEKKGHPDTLIFEDNQCNQTKYSTTPLLSALELRDTKEIVDVPAELYSSETNEITASSPNDHESAKNGNSGVYAYKKSGQEYSIYYIVDFDEGYVYYFTEGNQSTICDRIKIESGDLNSGLIITYHDGNDVWSYGLHFKWAYQPEILIVEDSSGFEDDFRETSLASALKLRDTKTIIDY